MPGNNPYYYNYAGYNPYNPYAYNYNPNQTFSYPVQANPQQVSQTNAQLTGFQQPSQGKQPINWVKNEKEVDEAYVEPNSAGVFWNENEPIIYLKKVDGIGKADITVYDIIERKQSSDSVAPAQETPSKDEFTQLVGVVNSLNNSVASVLKEIDTIKTDMYGVAGRKKSVKRSEVEEDG